MKIRLAKQLDYSDLMVLYNGFVGEDRYSKRDNDSFQKVLNDPNAYILVAEKNDKIIGFATFSIRTVVRYPKPIAELDEFFVVPECRKKGIGKQLLQTVLDRAKKRGCYRLYIESHYDHKAAHTLYDKMRFTNYGYHFIKSL